MVFFRLMILLCALFGAWSPVSAVGVWFGPGSSATKASGKALTRPASNPELSVRASAPVPAPAPPRRPPSTTPAFRDMSGVPANVSKDGYMMITEDRTGPDGKKERVIIDWLKPRTSESLREVMRRLSSGSEDAARTSSRSSESSERSAVAAPRAEVVTGSAGDVPARMTDVPPAPRATVRPLPLARPPLAPPHAAPVSPRREIIAPAQPAPQASAPAPAPREPEAGRTTPRPAVAERTDSLFLSPDSTTGTGSAVRPPAAELPAPLAVEPEPEVRQRALFQFQPRALPGAASEQRLTRSTSVDSKAPVGAAQAPTPAPQVSAAPPQPKKDIKAKPSSADALAPAQAPSLAAPVLPAASEPALLVPTLVTQSQVRQRTLSAGEAPRDTAKPAPLAADLAPSTVAKPARRGDKPANTANHQLPVQTIDPASVPAPVEPGPKDSDKKDKKDAPPAVTPAGPTPEPAQTTVPLVAPVKSDVAQGGVDASFITANTLVAGSLLTISGVSAVVWVQWVKNKYKADVASQVKSLHKKSFYEYLLSSLLKGKIQGKTDSLRLVAALSGGAALGIYFRPVFVK